MFQRGNGVGEKSSEQVGVRHGTLSSPRGRKGARRDHALPTREFPVYCPLAPPSIRHALCLIPLCLLAVGDAPLRYTHPHWLLFHVILSRSFLLAQATPSYLSPDSAFSLGSSPSHLPFILHLVLGV